jgi:dihydroneopterin aldolase
MTSERGDLAATLSDWTADPETGRSNSSPLYRSLCHEVEQLIRGDAFNLIGGRADMTAELIMAQLAHVHHLAPAAVRTAT